MRLGHRRHQASPVKSLESAFGADRNGLEGEQLEHRERSPVRPVDGVEKVKLSRRRALQSQAKPVNLADLTESEGKDLEVNLEDRSSARRSRATAKATQ